MISSSSAPPPGYTVRAPRLEDAEAIAALKRAADAGRRETDVTAAAVREEWALPRLTLEDDTWLVLTSDGEPAAYAFVFEDAPAAFVSVQTVHPDHEGRGLEKLLLDLSEARMATVAACAHASQATFAVVAYENDRERRDLYEARGFAPVRTFVRVQVSLKQEPPAADWPHGIVVRAFRRDRDEAGLHAALDEAFRDHWQPTEMSYDEWLAAHFAGQEPDLSLWWIAWDGDQVAGAVIVSATPLGGYVDELAVRRPWRRRGLGRALLLTAFTELRRRCLAVAYLGVDTLNPTGAMQLYASLGMRQAGEAHLVFEKRLSPD